MTGWKHYSEGDFGHFI